jgi:hypothetical protein
MQNAQSTRRERCREGRVKAKAPRVPSLAPSFEPQFEVRQTQGRSSCQATDAFIGDVKPCGNRRLCGKADSQDAAGVPMEGTTAGIALSEIRKCFRRARRSAKRDNGKRGPQAAKFLRHEGLHYDCIQVLSAGRPASRFVVQKAAASTVQFAFPT